LWASLRLEVRRAASLGAPGIAALLGRVKSVKGIFPRGP
jgi:hypothetical protein